MNRTIRTVLLVLAATFAWPAAAHATARAEWGCDKLTVYYTQFSSGTPGVAHLLVKVDDSGPPAFDGEITFPGPSYVFVVPLNLNDGRKHSVRVAHRWINRDARTWDETREVGPCGSPPTPPPMPEQPAPPVTVAPPVLAPPHPDSMDVPRARHHHRRIVRERRHHGTPRHRATSHRPPKSTG
jgi:hypothetical protein